MKKLFIAAAVAVISSGAMAADLKPYIEGQLGWSSADDVETKAYNGTYAGIAYNGRIKVETDSSLSGGVEIGLKNVGVENLRLGASYNRAQYDMSSVKAVGSLAYHGTTYAGSVDVTSALRADGISFDNSANLYMLNAYYDIKTSSPFTPFVGVSVGLADIEHAKDNEFAYGASAGAKYNFDKNLYLGLKGSFTRINGIKDELGLEYEDIDLWSAHALLGYEF